jgi:hypothetical protein
MTDNNIDAGIHSGTIMDTVPNFEKLEDTPMMINGGSDFGVVPQITDPTLKIESAVRSDHFCLPSQCGCSLLVQSSCCL